MTRKPKIKNDVIYFTLRVDEAIIKYNDPDIGEIDKNLIYQNDIYPAFNKLSENLINTYKCMYIDSDFEDLKHDVVAFLTEKLPNYSQESGKAYSYYTVAGRNYLIARNNKAYQKKKKKMRVDLEEVDEDRDLINEISYDDYKESLDEFISDWIDKFDRKIEEVFSHIEDQAIADSVLELFRVRKSLDNFNKKALYILIRERTGLKTQRITNVVNIIKEDFIKELTENSKVLT